MSRRLPASLAALALVAMATLGATVAPPASAAVASSAITESGKGAFSDLRVTVGQTESLLDQVVRISWTGGAPTRPGSGQYAINYLQIMQCWGDAETGPDRTQCQWGVPDSRGGDQVWSRQLSYGDTLVDPLETIKQTPGDFTPARVPFKWVTKKEEAGDGSYEAFNEYTTNEVHFGVTRVDGTGEEYFSVQSVREAPGLGCGEPLTKAGKTVGRSCWLVVVPRSDREVDGSVRTISSDNNLKSSPLSASNWRNRITFPLAFEPVGRPCPLGKAERKTLGHDLVSEAVTRWQPALCQNGGPVFSYSQVNDDTARRSLLSERPGLSFVTNATPNSDGAPAALGYAPVAISGISVAFNVDSQSPFRAPPEIKAKDGQRITQMRLTPRLVAKLLSSSYTRGSVPGAPTVAGNPTDLTKDPDFQAANPNFDGLSVSLPSLTVPADRADIVERVWAWVRSDSDAKAFLAGKPDPWGMKLNTSFVGVEFPRFDYPKPDTSCLRPTDQPELCILDFHPYSASGSEGARAAARGDTLSRTLWDSTTVPPAYKRDQPQPTGSRAILTLVDTASAERYGLEVAELKNAGGQFVAPTVASLTAASKSLDGGVSGQTKQPKLDNPDAKAYPLTSISYGALAPEALDADGRSEYATFLRYAAGSGQTLGLQPGNLPLGYAPLTSSMREQTNALATAVAKGSPPPESEDTETDVPSAGENVPSVDATSTDGETGATASAEPGAVSATTAELDANLVVAATPFDSAGAARLVPLAALLVGIMAAAAGIVLMRLSAAGRI